MLVQLFYHRHELLVANSTLRGNRDGLYGTFMMRAQPFIEDSSREKESEKKESVITRCLRCSDGGCNSRVGWERMLTPRRLRSCEPPANSASAQRRHVEHQWIPNAHIEPSGTRCHFAKPLTFTRACTWAPISFRVFAHMCGPSGSFARLKFRFRMVIRSSICDISILAFVSHLQLYKYYNTIALRIISVFTW